MGVIRSLSQMSTTPWVLMGDLNNVISQADKKGGRPLVNPWFSRSSRQLWSYRLVFTGVSFYMGEKARRRWLDRSQT